MEKIIFNSGENLSWKILFEMIINKAENDLKKYIDSWNYTWLWITAMRMPAFEISWEKSDEVWEKIREYIDENSEVYKDDTESFIDEKVWNSVFEILNFTSKKD